MTDCASPVSVAPTLMAQARALPQKLHGIWLVSLLRLQVAARAHGQHACDVMFDKSPWARLAKLAWAAPCSLVGLSAGAIALLLGGDARRAYGTLEVTLGESEAVCPTLTRLLPFRAIALGHVIVAVGRQELAQLRAHEHVHVQQYERWGALFFVAYAASGIWQLVNGRSPYWDNHFEVQARRLSRASLRGQRDD